MRNCGSLPQPFAVLLLHFSVSDPPFQPTPSSYPAPPHQDIFLPLYFFFIPFPNLSAVCHLPTIFSLFYNFPLPSLLAPSPILNRLTVFHSPPILLHSLPTEFLSLRGWDEKGIKLEISGVNADWNGTFPLLQPSSRTFLRSGLDTAGVAKEGGSRDGGGWCRV